MYQVKIKREIVTNMELNRTFINMYGFMCVYICVYIYIKPIRIDWEMVGNRLGYPSYVLQAGAFLAGALILFLHALFIQSTFWGCFYNTEMSFLKVCIVKNRRQ